MHMKKKLLALLCVLTCLVGLTACGTQEYSDAEMDKMSTACQISMSLVGIADTYGEDILSNGYNKEEMAALYTQAVGMEAEFGALDGLCTTWIQMKSEMEGVNDIGAPAAEIVGKEVVVTVPVDGVVCDGQVVFKYSNDMFLRLHEGDATANTTFAMKMAQAGSNMGKAGLNTLLGMGTVFVMLIVISFIISAFKLISNVGNKPKKEEVKAVETPAVVEEEELSDDTELVAVIMAAIKAYEGNGSTDGFVVRSIKKANRRI